MNGGDMEGGWSGDGDDDDPAKESSLGFFLQQLFFGRGPAAENFLNGVAHQLKEREKAQQHMVRFYLTLIGATGWSKLWGLLQPGLQRGRLRSKRG